MRLFLILIFITSFTSVIGQNVKDNPTVEPTIDVEIEKVISDPHYLLSLNGKEMEVNKTDVKKINKKWVDKIEIWTEEEIKRKYGITDHRPIVLITPKKKRVDHFLELINTLE